MNTNVRRVALRGALLCAPALVLAGVACGSSDDPQDPLELRTLDVNLSDVNDSGYEGQVVIVSTDDGRSVLTAVIGLNGARQGDFPASIQVGTCAGLAGAEAYKLNAFRGGYLSQEIAASLVTLTENEHAFVVFQSAQRQIYVACADIKD